MIDYTQIPTSKIRQVAYAEGYQKGKADGRTQVIDECILFLGEEHKKYGKISYIRAIEYLKEQE